jgi:hypothetical protein
MATQPGGSVTSRAASESRSGPGSSGSAPGNSHSANTATGAKFRHGLLQLMIHTIDPLHDGKVHITLTSHFSLKFFTFPFVLDFFRYVLFFIWFDFSCYVF